LRRYGSSVYALSLTGMGERSHLARYIDPAVINLDLHIKDVTELLESEGLERVILVGHAYAGMVISGVAEVCPQLLEHLVYVNGVVPRDDESMVDQLDAVRGPEFTAEVRAAINNREEFLPPQPRGIPAPAHHRRGDPPAVGHRRSGGPILGIAPPMPSVGRRLCPTAEVG